MRIKKVSQTSGYVGTVSNSYSGSTTDTYSCDYVNVLNTYSTDETRIGTWIDGKPLYRKTFTYSNLSQISSGNFGTISTGLTNVNVVKIEGLNINNNLGLTRALPYTDNTNLLRIVTTNNGNIIRLYVDGTFFTANDDAIISMYYTKTTD